MALKNGDRREIMGIAKSLYNHRKYVLSLGRKLHSCDDKVFREAEKLLCDEFAVVLGMKPSEVMPFIIHRLDERIVK
jgi:CarD family transcriptional regulator